MHDAADQQLQAAIIRQARDLGAACAGFADMGALRLAPSYAALDKSPSWPLMMQSVLVFGVAHPRTDPALDWWDARPGSTPGNRRLIAIQKALKTWLHDTHAIASVSLPYHESKGGIFLKDAAALAGLGIIGRNNLLLTPDHGGQIRWRAMLIAADLPAGDLLDFDPCAACDQRCWTACPQDAFATGAYDSARCTIQMNHDVDHPHTYADGLTHIRYCRACELACPVAMRE
jgi:epoxyqueuosine reductase